MTETNTQDPIFEPQQVDVAALQAEVERLRTHSAELLVDLKAERKSHKDTQAQLKAGADSFAVPYWKDFPNDEANITNDNPATEAVPVKLSSGKQIVRKSFLHKSWLAATSKGATKKGAAFALQVSDDVLSRWFNEHPELQEAFEKGRERERQTLHDVLYNAATKGRGKDSLIAAMFLLKSRHGYREGEQEVAQNRVQINFQLPGARPLDAYVIENGADSADTGTQRISAKPTRHP